MRGLRSRTPFNLGHSVTSTFCRRARTKASPLAMSAAAPSSIRGPPEQLNVFPSRVLPGIKSNVLTIMRGLRGSSLLVLPKSKNKPREFLRTERIKQIQLQHLAQFFD